MTGTDSVVNISAPSPQRAPQATFRPNLRSASRAISIRRVRVSSRNRLIRPSAAVASASGGLGLGQRADDRDLFAVDGDLGRLGEPVVGQPPVNQAA